MGAKEYEVADRHQRTSPPTTRYFIHEFNEIDQLNSSTVMALRLLAALSLLATPIFASSTRPTPAPTATTTILDFFPASTPVTQITHYGLILDENPSTTVVVVSCTPECIPVTATVHPTTYDATGDAVYDGVTSTVKGGCRFEESEGTRLAKCSDYLSTYGGGATGGVVIDTMLTYVDYIWMPVTASYADGVSAPACTQTRSLKA